MSARFWQGFFRAVRVIVCLPFAVAMAGYCALGYIAFSRADFLTGLHYAGLFVCSTGFVIACVFSFMVLKADSDDQSKLVFSNALAGTALIVLGYIIQMQQTQVDLTLLTIAALLWVVSRAQHRKFRARIRKAKLEPWNDLQTGS